MSNKTKTCKKPTSINYCQNKSSGGHQGTILSINKKTCIKKLTKINKEIIFYNEHKELIDNKITLLQDYIPKYDGICLFNNNKYFEMENLKSSFKQPLSIDIKFGYKTAHKQIIKTKTSNKFKIYSKLSKHYILDRLLSNSHKYGFRIEGVSLPNTIKLKKSTIMKSNLNTIFDYYFINDKNNIILNDFINKLTELSKTIEHYDFNRYLFVGASILFTYDGLNISKNPTLKIIDFDNSQILTDDNDIKKNFKHATKTRKAINSLISVLKINLLNKK